MLELNLEGYIKINNDGYPILFSDEYDINVVEMIRDFMKEKEIGTSFDIKGKYDLGGVHSILENCNIYMYFTKKECSLKQAIFAMDSILYSGKYENEIHFDGYSEFTITDLELETLTIGGHDLKSIFYSKKSKYCHFHLEVSNPINNLLCTNKILVKKMITFPDGEMLDFSEIYDVLEALNERESVTIDNNSLKTYLDEMDFIKNDCISFNSVSLNEKKSKEFSKFMKDFTKMVED